MRFSQTARLSERGPFSQARFNLQRAGGAAITQPALFERRRTRPTSNEPVDEGALQFQELQPHVPSSSGS